jgi:hypothetical protein
MKKLTAKQLGIKVYSSHKLAYGRIRVTYAALLGDNAISVQQTRTLPDTGGAVTSIAHDRGLL